MDFRSLLGRPGFRQAFHVDRSGHLEVASATERLPPQEIRSFQSACAELGQRLGLGNLVTLATECPGDAAVFVAVGPDGTTTGAVYGPAGDALDDRAREVRQAVYPSDGVVTRHMGFVEVRR